MAGPDPDRRVELGSGTRAAVRARAADLRRIVREHDLGNYRLTGTFVNAFAQRDGPASERLERMAYAMERYRLSGTLLGRSALLTHFAAHAPRRASRNAAWPR